MSGTKKSNSVSSTATQRLRQDYARLLRDPVPYVTAAPLPSNLFVWHYIIRGPPGSPYCNGYYHGKLVFPKEFPFRPPSIYMITPSGRFECNTRLCLSISDFHPDTWNPAWSISSILTGLLSFMLEDTQTLGSIESTPAIKQTLSRSSREFNLKSTVFCELFPEVAEEIRAALDAEQREIARLDPSSQNGSSTDLNRIYGTGRNTNTLTRRLPSLFVLIALGLFAFLVKIVMQAASESE